MTLLPPGSTHVSHYLNPQFLRSTYYVLALLGAQQGTGDKNCETTTVSQSKICISSNGDTIRQDNGLEQGWQTFSVKDQEVNILGSVGHTVSDPALRLYHKSSHR